jgi:hypothetical protein
MGRGEHSPVFRGHQLHIGAEVYQDIIGGGRLPGLDFDAGVIIAETLNVRFGVSHQPVVTGPGGDLIRIDSINFSVDDPSIYYKEAREKAMTDAKDRAEHLAELAGLTLGKPTYISEGAQTSVYRDVYYEMAVPTTPASPAPVIEMPAAISPGELEVSLTVQVAYSILP